MGNIITTIIEKLKITNPSRSEKAGYFLMHDADTHEVCAIPEAAILARVNKRIDGIIYPDGFTKTTPIDRVGNTITIAPYDFEWRMVLNPYTNADGFIKTFDPVTSPELKRIDSLAVTNEGTIVYHQGDEDEFIFKAPDIPSNQLWLTDVTIFGDGVQEHTEPFVSEVYTLAEKEKLAILNGTADIDKPVSTAQALADAAVLSSANSYTDSSISSVNKFRGKFLTYAALVAAVPTAAVGHYAQVNEVGSVDVVNYSWDDEENIWVQSGSAGSGATDTDMLPEGSSNLYFTGARVLAALLSGLSLATGGAIVSTDSILVAFGKLQKQINDLSTVYQSILVSGTNIKTVGGTSLLGSGDVSINTQGYDIISSSRSLTDADHGKTIWVTATCNITIPSGLRADFNCTFRTLTGATATFLTSGTTINSESDGDVQAPRTMSYLAVYSTNNYIISGGGLS